MSKEIMKSSSVLFIPNKMQRKFLRWFVEELEPQDIDKTSIEILALKGGFSPRKVRKWFKDPLFKEWFYEQVDEIFKLYARVLANQMLKKALSGQASDKEKMFLVKLFLQEPRVYKHEYKTLNVTVKSEEQNKEIYDYQIIKTEKDGEDNLVSE